MKGKMKLKRRKVRRTLKNGILKSITTVAFCIDMVAMTCTPENGNSAVLVAVIITVCTTWLLLFGLANGLVSLPPTFMERKETSKN